MQTEILLAAYNGAEFISEQIESILRQTYTSWHLTLSDDCSSDKTAAIIDDYVRLYPDKISRVVSDRHFGNPKDHFFYLLSLTDAPRIVLCDQDDVWFPDKLKKMNAAMDTVPESIPALVFSDLSVTDAYLNCINPSVFNMEMRNVEDLRWQTLLFRNVITGCASMINQALAKQSLLINQTQDVIMHDWWLGIVAARFGRILKLDEPTGYYRRHGRNCVNVVDVRSFSFFIYRIIHINKTPHRIAIRKAQAALFLSVYGEALSSMDRAYLSYFITSRFGHAFWKSNSQYIHGVPIFAFLTKH